MTSLLGIAWNHARGYDPVVACAESWRDKTGVEITWEKRSLQDFESYPVDELARRYDLIVIHHTHVGQITREHCLLPLDVPDRREALETLCHQSVGPSFESYRYGGHVWALPIDAAAQVQAWRPDRIKVPATNWDQVIEMARTGRVMCPMRPPHALMMFFTLAGNLGRPCNAEGPGPLIDPVFGVQVFERMRALMTRVDTACYTMDPIAAYEMLADGKSQIACIPLIYGFVSYAREDFRGLRIAFADIPAVERRGPIGSTLGGTGLAVSARSAHPKEAIDFAFWIAGAEIQRSTYALAGGQPANAVAWDDEHVNRPTHGFYIKTRATLEGAWVRPRHDGYMAFQDNAATVLVEALRSNADGAKIVAELNRQFDASFR
ncbi:MAG TPA: extracellular solute-binding protein [Magnetospirillaceae bacterium]|jgi:multiple sugar transport system substrate-binding protein